MSLAIWLASCHVPPFDLSFTSCDVNFHPPCVEIESFSPTSGHRPSSPDLASVVSLCLSSSPASLSLRCVLHRAPLPFPRIPLEPSRHHSQTRAIALSSSLASSDHLWSPCSCHHLRRVILSLFHSSISSTVTPNAGEPLGRASLSMLVTRRHHVSCHVHIV